jgi:hypothetical protein
MLMLHVEMASLPSQSVTTGLLFQYEKIFFTKVRKDLCEPKCCYWTFRRSTNCRKGKSGGQEAPPPSIEATGSLKP